LGYRRPPHLHIVELTEPSRRDKRSRYEFDRCDLFHARHARMRWKASRGMIDCVGEWHTHPEVDPRPSSLDKSEWRRILAESSTLRVFVIAGLESDWFGIGSRTRLKEAHTVDQFRNVQRSPREREKVAR
jgi:integrative and conjugative element protein (TIGR02256 family)